MEIVRHQSDVVKEEVTLEGVKNCNIQWLLKTADGMPNFQMRRFTMGPGGIIPLHSHEWEHEVFVLSGKGELLNKDGGVPVEAGSVAYVDGVEPHGFKNTGSEDFIFLCMIPNEEY